MLTHTHTHAHTRQYALCKGARASSRVNTCRQLPVDMEVEALGHYQSVREMKTPAPTLLQRLLISPPVSAGLACVSLHSWSGVSFVCRLTFKCQKEACNHKKTLQSSAYLQINGCLSPMLKI